MAERTREIWFDFAPSRTLVCTGDAALAFEAALLSHLREAVDGPTNLLTLTPTMKRFLRGMLKREAERIHAQVGALTGSEVRHG